MNIEERRFYLKKIMMLLLAGMLLFTSVVHEAAASVKFTDLEGSYAQADIHSLAARGIVSGDGHGHFFPKKPVTRAEFTAMLVRLLALEPVYSSIRAFDDVTPQSWSYGWIHAAVNLSMVKGKEERRFDPTSWITREEAAALAARAMKQPSDPAAGQGNLTRRYKDMDDISGWAREEVNTVTSLGWMQGSQGYFRPGAAITRQEAVMLLSNILQSGSVKRALDSYGQTAASGISMGWFYQGTAAQYMAYAERAGLNTVSPRWYFLNEDGSVSNHTNDQILQWSRQNRVAVWAMLGNRFNKESTHRMLQDAAQRKSVIQSVAGYVSRYQLAGINLDFENVSPQDRELMTLFVSELSAALHPIGAVLSVDVSPDLGTDWTAAFDMEAIGYAADYTVLMAYEEHWSGSQKAGSVASLPWVTSAVDQLLTQMPASKIILALPLYTRAWNRSDPALSRDITLTEQQQLSALPSARLRWDALAGQYIADYTQKGTAYSIWTEEERSLTLKHLLAADRGLAGIAYWYSGAENKELWSAVRNARKYQSYDFKF
ncbi:S-layer homology domain-containing protein [Paenibacillus sp. F411]|nr:S-layer homology domain-containing protein [Paenibacillus sp. F411]